jgi:hypothetical protein
MKNTLVILLFGISMHYTSSAQQLSPSFLSSSGDMSQGAGILLEWALGDLAVETTYSKASIYTQGFIQPLLIIEELEENDRQFDHYPGHHLSQEPAVLVYPNPTRSYLKLEFEQAIEAQMCISLVDVYGKNLLQYELQRGQDNLNVQLDQYPDGIYLLRVVDKTNQSAKTFKITKTH